MTYVPRTPKPILVRLRGNKKALVLIAGFAVVGTLYVLLSLAATTAGVLEAEAAATSGAAHVIDDSGASGGKALRFGQVPGATSAPAWVRTFVGGDSIAVRWKAVDSKLAPAKYHVFRDGKEVGVFSPEVLETGSLKEDPFYIDKNVTVGTKYSYQVKAELKDGTMSAFSPTAEATHEVGVGVPMVKVVDNGINDPAYVSAVSDAIKTWYPKIEKITVNGAYPAPAEIKLILATDDSGCGGIAYAIPDDASFTACPVARKLTSFTGTTVHELTHILQLFTASGIERMMVEGSADWVKFTLLFDEFLEPSGPYYFDDGYAQAAYFFEWLRAKYGPSLVHDLFVAEHKGVRAQDFLQQLTGKTVGQLWTSMTGKYTTSHGPLRNGDGMCVMAGPPEGNVLPYVNYTPRMWSCTGYTLDEFVYGGIDSTGASGFIKDSSYDVVRCIAPADLSPGATLQYNECLVTVGSHVYDPLWELTSDGELRLKETGLCLRPRNGDSSASNLLEQTACAGANAPANQKWTLPPQ